MNIFSAPHDEGPSKALGKNQEEIYPAKSSQQKRVEILDDINNPYGTLTRIENLRPEMKNQRSSTEIGENEKDPMENLENISPNVFFTPNDLTELLKKTDTGKRLLQNSNRVLSNDSKKELASIIASYHLTSSFNHPDPAKRKLSALSVENYVRCIILRFPHESCDMVSCHHYCSCLFF